MYRIQLSLDCSKSIHSGEKSPEKCKGKFDTFVHDFNLDFVPAGIESTLEMAEHCYPSVVRIRFESLITALRNIVTFRATDTSNEVSV